MSTTSPSTPLDFPQIAANVRGLRMAHNLTQAELAERATVDTATVRRLESGRRVHIRTLQRVCDALQRPMSMVNSKASFDPPASTQALFFQAGESVEWHTFADTRKRIPEDSHARIQFEPERLRLGRSGMVGMFLSFRPAMPEGPGITTAEVYAEVEVDSSKTYSSCVYLCLRGDLFLVVEGEVKPLVAGDSIGLFPNKSVILRPAEAIGRHDLPPIVVVIGANRVGRIPGEPSGRKRVRPRRFGSRDGNP